MYNTNVDIWLAGAFSAVIVDFAVYPFDTLKTRIQSPDYTKLYKDSRGTLKRDILFRGLFQGVWSVVIATIPSSGAFFTTYEAVKDTLNNANVSSHGQDRGQKRGERHRGDDNILPFTHTLPDPIIHAISSSTAEMVACLMVTPAEVLKQNAQVVNLPSGPKNDGATLQVMSRFRHRPWKLWSGYAALVGRNLPFTALHFPIFEHVRYCAVEWRERRKVQTDLRRWEGGWNPILERAVLTGFAAGVSGMSAAVVTTPIDVIKTRVMLSAIKNEGESGDRKADGRRLENRSMWSIGREIYRKDGIKGLFRGGAIRAVWSAVSLSMYLSIYEGGRFYLENRRKEKNGLEAHLEVEREDEAAM